MMDIKQSIEWFENLKGHYDNMANRESSVMSQILKDGMNKNIGYLELAIKALEKQIPRKMTKDNMWMICPNCGTSYYIFEVEKYCDICGQKLGVEE